MIVERPILFSAPMVRSILAGTKTQTRRVAKFEAREPGYNLAFSGIEAGHYCTDVPSSGSVLYSRGRGGVWEQRTKPLHCPYGQPGGLLWVRETWAPEQYAVADPEGTLRKPAYRADWTGEPARKWRPSIHMPRVASRITLRVTAVRVERLQDISNDDAKAEGCVTTFGDYGAVRKTALEAFTDLWQSLNAERAPWSSNPWVWVIEFERAT